MTICAAVRPRDCLGLVLATVFTSCASFSSGSEDDKDPELLRRSGDRATVVVAENAFAFRSGGGVGGYSVQTTGPDGKTQTHTVEWNVHGGWSKGSAQNLGVFFRDAMLNSGAFWVTDARLVSENIQDEALRRQGHYADATSHKGQMDRADLKLVCTLTKFEHNAKGKTSRRSGGVVQRFVPSFLRGSSSRSTKRAECAIQIEIWDRAKARLLATARGEGFSIGSKQRKSAYGWTTSAIFGGRADSTYENTDMEAAIRRACVRAVNDLVTKIPGKYFRHE